MKHLNKKQIILLVSILICFINIIIFLFLVNYAIKNITPIKNSNKDKIVYNIKFNKEIYYIGLNENYNITITNDNNIEYKLESDDNNIVDIIDDNTIKGINYGNTDIVIILPDNTVEIAKVYVVKGMIKRPNEFNYDKSYITCNYFSNDENKILDNALAERINSVSYPSRASVVEAARFLTLSFDFRIPYFYENGRLNNYGGKEHVDGEGRYYHKGLYLSESKYNDLTAILYGPQSWGCPLTNITKANGYGYYVGSKYPNGLDCSGFISWTLYNGGFDIGDTGAGETYRKDDLYDLGKKTPLTLELLNSDKIKVGDLIAYSGHMAMIIGINDEYIFIAETLPHLKGVVAKKYTRESAKNTFTHIMLMDSVYKKDGVLSNMWY